jgi:hypothetical protein
MSNHPGILPALLTLACLAGVTRAEPLRPSAGRQVAANVHVVSAELRQVFERDSSREVELLKEFVDTGTDWRIYYRDRQLLFAIPVTRNLLGGEKAKGEREMAELATATLQQKFSHLLALDDASAGLDRSAVRVVFIEPDADKPYVRSVTGPTWNSGNQGSPTPFAPAGAWSGWAAPMGGCGCH